MKNVTLIVLVAVVLLLTLSTTVFAQTGTPPGPTAPTAVPAPSAPIVSTQANDILTTVGPLAIAAIFAALLGFFGLQRLQNLDKEILSARQERDRLRDELRADLRDGLDRALGELDRALKVHETRLSTLESRITSEVEAQRTQFRIAMHSHEQHIAKQASELREHFVTLSRQAEGFLSEIDRRREQFNADTAWLKAAQFGTTKPRNVGEAHALATAATSAGRRAEAVQILRLIVDPNENLFGTHVDYFNAAVQAAALNEHILAKQIDAAGLKHYPDNIDLLADYADTCGKIGDIAEAERVWAELSRNPRAKSNWRYWIFYSDFLESQGDFDGSFQLLEEAKKYLPNPSMAFREQAEAMENRSRYDEAVKLYEEALKFDPSEDIARLKLASLLFKTGRLEEALEHINWAIRYVLPRNARYFTAHYYKGQILLALGEGEQAKRALRVAEVYDEDARILLQAMRLEEGQAGEEQHLQELLNMIAVAQTKPSTDRSESQSQMKSP